MRKPILAALFCGAALAAMAPAASALPLTGPQLAARINNGEFRGYTLTSRGFENQIWHFLPDGRVRAVADARKTIFRREDYHQQWQDIGAWRVEGDRVCIAFQGLNQNLNGCYAVDAGQSKHVRLVGPYVWEGTLEAYE